MSDNAENEVSIAELYDGACEKNGWDTFGAQPDPFVPEADAALEQAPTSTGNFDPTSALDQFRSPGSIARIILDVGGGRRLTEVTLAGTIASAAILGPAVANVAPAVAATGNLDTSAVTQVYVHPLPAVGSTSAAEALSATPTATATGMDGHAQPAVPQTEVTPFPKGDTVWKHGEEIVTAAAADGVTLRVDTVDAQIEADNPDNMADGVYHMQAGALVQPTVASEVALAHREPQPEVPTSSTITAGQRIEAAASNAFRTASTQHGTTAQTPSPTVPVVEGDQILVKNSSTGAVTHTTVRSVTGDVQYAPSGVPDGDTRVLIGTNNERYVMSGPVGEGEGQILLIANVSSSNANTYTAAPLTASISPIPGIEMPAAPNTGNSNSEPAAGNQFGATAPSLPTPGATPAPVPTETAPAHGEGTPTGPSPTMGNKAPTSPFGIVTHPDTVKDIPSDVNLGGVVYDSETDPRWAQDAYHGVNGEGTIGWDGCGAATLAMAISTFSHQMVNPETIAKYDMKYGLVTADGAATYDDAMTSVPEAYGVKSYQIPVDKTNVEDVLKAGGLVIIDGNTHKAGGFPTPAMPGGHFYLIRGMNAAGGWLIANPDDTVPLGPNSESNVPWNPEHILAPADVAYAVFPGQGVAYTHQTQPTYVAAPTPRATTPISAPAPKSTEPSHETLATGGYLDANNVWHSNVEKNGGPYTVESYAINVLEAIAAMKHVPVGDVVTPPHILSMVTWTEAEGGNIGNPQFFNPYNNGLTNAPYLVAGAVNGSGIQSYNTFDDGATAVAWTITEQGTETKPWQTRLAGVLTDPNSTVQDFINVLVNPENYPGNLGWAGGEAVYDPQYKADLEGAYNDVIGSYTQYASYEIGPGFNNAARVNHLPDTLQYQMTAPGVLTAIHQPSSRPSQSPSSASTPVSTPTRAPAPASQPMTPNGQDSYPFGEKGPGTGVPENGGQGQPASGNAPGISSPAPSLPTIVPQT